MTTAREYLYGLGLTKAPTGKGRFSREGNDALASARKSGTVFDDDVKIEKPIRAKVAVESTPKSIALPGAKSVDPKAVRKWAAENGHTVGERGRIHIDITNAYLTAMGDAGETIEKREDEFNVYADTKRPTFPADAMFTGEYEYKGKTHTLKVSTRAACTNCRTSLIICHCGNPSVVSGHGGGFVKVTMIEKR